MNGSSDLVIIGGGITGLSAAYYAAKKAEENGQTLNISVIEQSARLGGKIETLYKDGCIIEKGPDSFLARKVAMIDLAYDLGLESELVATNPHAKHTYIVRRGVMHPMPSGLILGIPTEWVPFAKTGLISVMGKLRALMDLFKKRRMCAEDESLGTFLHRRLGNEVMEHITEPLLAGIYAGDMSKLSLQQTFPQFAEVERKYGSLIKGMIASRKTGQSLPKLPDAARGSTFLTFRSGLASLVERLEDVLRGAGVDLHVDVRATRFDKLENGRYLIHLNDDITVEASSIVVTTPSYHAESFLRDHVNTTALQAIEHVSVANVVSVFERSVMNKPLDGTGFLLSRKEKRAITACTWTSIKWPHTSRGDKLIVRCYIGRAGDEERVDWPDEALKRTVHNELRDLMGITAQPDFVEITRLKHSMPQYPVGHVQAIKQLRKVVGEQLPGVFLAGQPYEGAGMPDCIRSGRIAGEQSVAFLAGNT